MSNEKRTVFLVSDGTGITANNFVQSLLTQFEMIEFEKKTLSQVNTLERVQEVIEKINAFAKESGTRPVIFATMINTEYRHLLSTCNALFLDLFGKFIEPLELEFRCKSSHVVGRAYSPGNPQQIPYEKRIAAINFTLEHDDGGNIRHYDEADVILIGVSRSGKTPTSVYLALHHGISVANYPFLEEDLQKFELPDFLKPHHHKIFGLTIKPERLQQIRQERRPNSSYSSLIQCQLEVQRIEALYRRLGIPFLNATTMSVEELGSAILEKTQLRNKYVVHEE